VKELQGSAAADVAVPAADCLVLFTDVERYPDWYPDVVRRVTVVERDPDGRPRKVRALLHVAYGPLVRDFDLTLVVRDEPTTVTLTRVPHGPGDPEQFRVSWRVVEGARSRIELRLNANLSVPRLVPVGGVGDGLARGFVDAAARQLSR
jgi:ribosome-associated toxin RatA of RatAB toxin-antitoxin module